MASLKLSSIVFFILCIHSLKSAGVLTTFSGGGQYNNPSSLDDSRYGFKVNEHAKYNNDYYWGWVGGRGSTTGYGYGYGVPEYKTRKCKRDSYDNHRSNYKSEGEYKHPNFRSENQGDNSSRRRSSVKRS
uniref:Uncharacterized protein n=1 Tax=Cucumis melo TaxID=3656 RepID=A0A9I9E8R9_CUCME